MLYRVPISLVFRDGEVIVSAIFFDYEPTQAEVKEEAIKIARQRGAREVVIPQEEGE